MTPGEKRMSEVRACFESASEETELRTSVFILETTLGEVELLERRAVAGRSKRSRRQLGALDADRLNVGDGDKEGRHGLVEVAPRDIDQREDLQGGMTAKRLGKLHAIVVRAVQNDILEA